MVMWWIHVDIYLEISLRTLLRTSEAVPHGRPRLADGEVSQNSWFEGLKSNQQIKQVLLARSSKRHVSEVNTEGVQDGSSFHL